MFLLVNNNNVTWLYEFDDIIAYLNDEVLKV